MRTLFIVASVMLTLFLAAPDNLEAQGGAQGKAFFDCVRSGRDFRAGGIKIVKLRGFPQIAAPRTPQERKFNADVLKIVRHTEGYNGFSTPYVTPEFVSVELWSKVCGASCHGLITAFNFDLKTGKRVNKLPELFKPQSNYLETIASYSVGELRRCQWGEEDDWFREGTEPTASNYKIWSLTRDGIRITFPEYQIAPGAFPGIQVVVPYGHLQGMMREDIDWLRRLN